MHFCYSHRDVFLGMLGGRWQLNRIVYVIPPDVSAEIEENGFSLDFAIRYMKGVAVEFGVEIEFREDPATPVVVPERVYAPTRHGDRYPLVRGAKRSEHLGKRRRARR